MFEIIFLLWGKSEFLREHEFDGFYFIIVLVNVSLRLTKRNSNFQRVA